MVVIKNIYCDGQPVTRKQSTLTVCIVFYLDECFILFPDRCSKWRFTPGASQHKTQFFIFLMFRVINKYQYTRLFDLS